MDPLQRVCGTHFNFSSKIVNLLCSNPFFQQILFESILDFGVGVGLVLKGVFVFSV